MSFDLTRFPGGSEVKASARNAGDPGLIPGLGRSPGGGHSSPLQYSCLENSMDRGAWRAPVHAVPKSRTGLSDQDFNLHYRSTGLYSEMKPDWVTGGTIIPLILSSFSEDNHQHSYEIKGA